MSNITDIDSESDSIISQDITLQINEPEDTSQTKKNMPKDGSTSSLWKHIKSKHNELYLEVNQITEALNKLEISESLV
uniref:Uncharacterized protein n=1 Tax=Rhizophagus irregularis (strain DAOM 181602 / DAOM 197198 / MUCL 43194) TaxID=747089 RepID=U9TC34_RHIID